VEFLSQKPTPEKESWDGVILKLSAGENLYAWHGA
jgi:hypothetical protein